MSGNVAAGMVFLVNTLGGLYIMTFLLRFILQLRRADFYNPLSQFVVKVTNPLLKPLRRIVPGWQGLDIATLLIVYLLSALLIFLLAWMSRGVLLPVEWVAWYGLLKVIIITINLYFLTLILQVILSWVSQGGYNPIAGALFSINEPLLRPFRKLLPPIGGFDLSPLFAIILLQFLRYLIPLPGGLA